MWPQNCTRRAHFFVSIIGISPMTHLRTRSSHILALPRFDLADGAAQCALWRGRDDQPNHPVLKRKSTNLIRKSQDLIRNSPSLIRNSPNWIRNSPHLISYSANLIRRSPNLQRNRTNISETHQSWRENLRIWVETHPPNQDRRENHQMRSEDGPIPFTWHGLTLPPPPSWYRG